MRFQGSPQPVPYATHTSNRVPNVAGYGPQYQTFAGTVPMHPLGPSVPLVPNLTAWGVNDVTAQMGMQFGRSAVAAGQDYVEKNVSKNALNSSLILNSNGIQINTYLPVSLLKHQFNVSNSYVLQKLRLVIFPWRHRPWSRQVRKSDAGQNEGWKPPREDINSPDLYIPCRCLSCLLCGCRRN
jgi:protein transport protein YIF1